LERLTLACLLSWLWAGGPSAAAEFHFVKLFISLHFIVFAFGLFACGAFDG